MKMQSKKQAGFTLIELMIVVTIIGILASIAVPAYRDYTVRTRVGECASVFSPLKTEYAIFYSETSTLPADMDDLALNSLGRLTATVTDYRGDYVTSVELTDPTIADCVLKDVNALGSAADGTVRFTSETSNNTIRWTISGDGVEQKYLPTNL